MKGSPDTGRCTETWRASLSWHVSYCEEGLRDGKMPGRLETSHYLERVAKALGSLWSGGVHGISRNLEIGQKLASSPDLTWLILICQKWRNGFFINYANFSAIHPAAQRPFQKKCRGHHLSVSLARARVKYY